MISETQVETITRATLVDAVPCFCPSDTIRVDRILDCIHVEYMAASVTSSARDATYFQMRFHPAQHLMWIRNLRVASEFRAQGWGRRLTQAAEAVARALGADTINVYPLTRARSFWERAGYNPHRYMTRVLTKHPNAESA